MAKQASRDEIVLSARSLAIVFKERKSKKCDLSKSNDSRTPVTNEVKSGLELFNAFVNENNRCYWDPHLEESVTNLKYEGHVHPHTILVTGRDIYLDTVKNAWLRRAIRSPSGFTVHRLGDVASIVMSPIPQTQFTPLPEALCIIISDLTKTQPAASFDAILDHMKDIYKGLQQPTEQITYETLGSLIKERKIYHTGSGYHILTPDLYHPGSKSVALQDHHLVIGGTGSPHGVTPTLYIPLVNPSNPTDTRSISCQTDVKTTDTSTDRDGDKDEKHEKEEKTKKKIDRSPSLKESKKTKKHDKDVFSRSSSVRYGDEKAKALVKDVNLKTSDVNQDRDKGEKSSLLSKLFGRNKTKDPTPVMEEEDTPELVEYATFSAQFPPPEWNWYESQIERLVGVQDQHRTVNSGAMVVSRSSTWHHMSPAQMLDEGTQSDLEGVYDEIHVHSAECPISRSHTLPVDMSSSLQKPPPGDCSSPSESWSSLNDLPAKFQYRDLSGSSQSKSHKHDQSGERHVRSLDSLEQENRADFPTDVQSKTSDVVSPEPARVEENQVFYRNTFDSPQLLNNASMPPERPTHVNKVFKKYREMKCTSFCTNDISVEYCGKMQRKDHAMSMSRDSGVNCIGLPNSNTGKPQMYGKNHYNAYQAPVDRFEEPGKDNTAPRPIDVVHEAQIHLNPGASQEDSGFNSMRFADSQDNTYTRLQGPYSSTPNNISPSQQYENSAEQLPAYQPDSSRVRNSSQSPEHLSCEDRYPAHERYGVANGYCNVDANIVSSDRQGSGTSLWSDTSKQTVREVKLPGMSRKREEPRKNGITFPTSHAPTSHAALRESSPIRHRSHNIESYTNGELSKRSHKHNHSRPKSPRRSTKDSDRYPRTKATSRPGSATGKTLANHVYESHQKRQSRAKCPVVEQPRDMRDRSGYNINIGHNESTGGVGAKPKVVGIV